jgi:hypothetical protein
VTAAPLLSSNGEQRALYGAVVCFENAHGATYSIHRPCAGVDTAVKEACEMALKLDGTFRVVCISTPSSVYSDLKGRRDTHLIEDHALSRAGMRWMLHPRLALIADGRRRDYQRRSRRLAQ